MHAIQAASSFLSTASCSAWIRNGTPCSWYILFCARGLINVSCSGCKKMIGWNPSGCIGVYIRRYGIRVLKEHSWSLPLVCSRSPFLMESLLLLSKSNWSYAIHFSTHLYGWISLTDLDQWIIKRELIFERILASICSSTLRKASPSLQFDSA